MEANAWHIAHTPLGWMKFEGDSSFIRQCHWIDEEEAVIGGAKEKPEWQDQLEAQLKEYFDKQRQDFNLPVDPQGTEFQQVVWTRLREIPHGETNSYLDLAKEFGNRDLSQAVGNAVGANPLLLLIPCHRVIGTNGSLTGYAGGLDKKQWLLEHEDALNPERQLRLF